MAKIIIMPSSKSDNIYFIRPVENCGNSWSRTKSITNHWHTHWVYSKSTGHIINSQKDIINYYQKYLSLLGLSSFLRECPLILIDMTHDHKIDKFDPDLFYMFKVVIVITNIIKLRIINIKQTINNHISTDMQNTK